MIARIRCLAILLPWQPWQRTLLYGMKSDLVETWLYRWKMKKILFAIRGESVCSVVGQIENVTYKNDGVLLEYVVVGGGDC